MVGKSNDKKRNRRKAQKKKRRIFIRLVSIIILISVALQIMIHFNMFELNHSFQIFKDAAKEYFYFPKNNEFDEEFLVCIDAGHGGKDPGAMINHHVEKEETLELAGKVKKYLEKNDIKVMMTRENDEYITPKDRAKMANKAKAKLFISIHRNSLPTSKETNGIDIYINSQETEQDYALGNALKYYLERAGKMNVNQVSPGSATNPNENYIVIGKTKMPAALVEMGYLTNRNDNIYLEESTNAYAMAITNAVIQYLEEY